MPSVFEANLNPILGMPVLKIPVMLKDIARSYARFPRRLLLQALEAPINSKDIGVCIQLPYIGDIKPTGALNSAETRCHNL